MFLACFYLLVDHWNFWYFAVLFGWTEGFCPHDSDLNLTRTISSNCYATNLQFKLVSYLFQLVPVLVI